MNNQQVAQKVAKIREVVTGVSTNDIILALHTYDMNVEKTIQAFCEDGASSVLDDWVRPAGSGKNKNKKKKNTAPVAPIVTAPKASAAVEVKTVPVVVPPTVTKPVASIPKSNGTTAAKEKQTGVTKSHAAENVQAMFKSIRLALNERENILISACNGTSCNFSGDLPGLISVINAFGSVSDSSKPVAVKVPKVAATEVAKSVSPVQPVIKHATSQSSISSSVGADSGVNLSPTHKDEKINIKPAAQVSSGGIQMSSDALSADQLADIQKKLQAQLAASGIDASVLSGVTSGDMPARRPRKPQENRNRNAKDSKNNRPQPQLSIFD